MKNALIKDPRHLPHHGQLFHSAHRQHEATIVFVHHFGGRRNSVLRHQQMVAQMGFDSVSFDLSFQNWASARRLPLTHDFQLGIFEVWVEEIHHILTALPGKKIIYSFSMPSAAALAAIVERNATDVLGWICDGGPFVQLAKCVWNYMGVQSKIKNPLLRASMAAGFYALLKGEKFVHDIHKNMAKLPPQFPVLSIRCWQDRLVPMTAIDQAFRDGQQLALEIFSLPEGDHLQGLITSPDDYRSRVSQFLTSLTERPQ